MRTNRLYGLLAALLLFTFGGYAQETEIITLLCNTDGLNQDNILQQCRFEDQDGPDTKNFLYESSALENNIIWAAYDTSGNNRRINVIRVRYLRGTNPFPWAERNGNAKGRVEGGQPTQPTEGTNEGDMVYSIRIQVPGLGAPMDIDPLLKIPN